MAHLRASGYPDAHNYDPTDTSVGGIHAFFLLLGEPEQLLDPGAQARIRRPFLLLKLPVSLSQVLMQTLDLILLLAQIPFKLGEMLVDLLRIVATHHFGELARLLVIKEVGELCVNIGLHVA